jgi:hypothetical protein
MNPKRTNLYKVPMSRKEGAYAYIKASSKKEAQKKFDNDEIDHTVFDSDFSELGETPFTQDGKIELDKEDIPL